MRKPLTILAFAVLLSTPIFAAYTVVLKDGTRYQAKAKWTMQGQRALITLTNGQSMLIDPSLIDVAKSEQMTKSGMGDVNQITSVEEPAPATTRQQQPSLGSSVRMRGRGAFGGAAGTTPETTSTSKSSPTANETVADQLDLRLKDNFERAYENVGIFEHRMMGTNQNVRAELTADSEDKVFNAVSATAFLIVRNALVEGVQIDQVDLYLKTTSGGAAGRFQMNRADAEAINTKAMSLPDYFVRKVIY